jgi:hypothetical protein
VAGGRNRQKLCETFDNRDQNTLRKSHKILFLWVQSY